MEAGEVRALCGDWSESTPGASAAELACIQPTLPSSSKPRKGEGGKKRGEAGLQSLSDRQCLRCPR
ncbi:hypothetical protein JRQ81_004988 [Phrynocephalus forsythii]|uniref:Uncharacterized protein n=2 Tax=Toxicofera TaxID=1329911 RepID=A0A9Q0XFY1_9SAUR|nr:hypothetical protein JRQ81_004988 [Phrynocephalus forsythii]